MNPHEAAARATKTLKLLTAIDRLAVRFGAGIPRGIGAANAIRTWDSAAWRTVATEADCRHPSATTIEAICQAIESREPREPVWADAPCDCGAGKRGHACPSVEERLATALRRHDWTYQYSDYARAFENGRRERDTIDMLVSALDVETARRIWTENAPRDQAFPETRAA